MIGLRFQSLKHMGRDICHLLLRSVKGPKKANRRI